MTPEERIAYLELTYRRSPEGSARRLWAAAQLKTLHPSDSTRPTGPNRPTGPAASVNNESYHHTSRPTSREG